MTKIYFDDVPDNKTVIEYIKSKLNWEQAVNDLGGVRSDVIKDPIRQINNSARVLGNTYAVYAELGAVNWQSRNSCELYGLSLTYNKNNNENTWKLGSFGHQRYQKLDSYSYFTAVKADESNRLKGDYLDSLSFRHIHPAVINQFSLRTLLQSFDTAVHRVTARTINGNMVYRTLPGDGGMHKDENQFESLRVNVCLSNNGEFGLQYEGHDPSYPCDGDINFVNTDVMHRAYINNRCEFQRTHLIINLSPWLDFDPINDCWSPNKYFGKVHPVDMVKQGLIFKQGTL